MNTNAVEAIIRHIGSGRNRAAIDFVAFKNATGFDLANIDMHPLVVRESSATGIAYLSHLEEYFAISDPVDQIPEENIPHIDIKPIVAACIHRRIRTEQEFSLHGLACEIGIPEPYIEHEIRDLNSRFPGNAKLSRRMDFYDWSDADSILPTLWRMAASRTKRGSIGAVPVPQIVFHYIIENSGLEVSGVPRSLRRTLQTYGNGHLADMLIGWSEFVSAQVAVLEGLGLVERDSDGTARATLEGRKWHDLVHYTTTGQTVLAGRKLDSHNESALAHAIVLFRSYMVSLDNEISEVLGLKVSTPTRLVRLGDAAAILIDSRLPIGGIKSGEIADLLFLVCKSEVANLRTRREQLRGKVKDTDLFLDIEKNLSFFDEIMRDDRLECSKGALRPQITDFINIGTYHEHLGRKGIDRVLEPRVADEKFGILNAPSLFAKDYDVQKMAAFERRRGLSVAFVDIDNFKAVNSRYTESVVDRDILPYFMRAVEAFCYARASAYRQGGDEYVIILNNCSADEAAEFFERLRVHVKNVAYPEPVIEAPTVSIGFHVITPENDVSVWEAVAIANAAKNRAKIGRKDRVCASSADEFMSVTGIEPVDTSGVHMPLQSARRRPAPQVPLGRPRLGRLPSSKRSR